MARHLSTRGVLVLCAFLAAPVSAGLASESSVKQAQLHFLRATLLERRGAYAEALEEYERVFNLDPASAFVCRQASGCPWRWETPTRPAAGSSASSSWSPKSPVKILLGRMEWARGATNAAETAFQEALKLDPKSAESIFSLGSLLSAYAPEKARALFLKFLELNPDEAAEAHYQLALLEQKAGRVPEAIARLKKGLELSPGALPMRYALAQIYEVRRDTDAALAEYLVISRQEPKNAALLNHIGEIYHIKGMKEEARERFETAKGLLPGDPVSSMWLAMLAEEAGDYGRAADALKSSSGLKDDAWLNLRLSYFLTQAGRLKEAVAALEAAHQRWPANDEISYFLALGYDDLKQGPQAVKLLKIVLQAKPEYRDARYQLAVIHEKYGDIDSAEKEFRLLLSRKADDAGVLNYLGYSLADRGLKLAEAEALIKEAVRLDPKNGAFQDSLGWVYFKQGLSTAAVRELEGASRRLPEDGTIWDHLGEAYLATGDGVAAWKAFKRAQSLEPGNLRFNKKAAKLQPRLESADLGSEYLAHLAGVQGGIRRYGGVCDLSVSLGGKSFSYTALLSFKAREETDLSILGPLFTPLVRMRLTNDGFQMDPIHMEGVRTEAVTDSAYAAISLIHDYFSGKAFSGGAARYEKSWLSHWVEVPGWRFLLDAEGLKAEGLQSTLPGGMHLALEEFSSRSGRQIPSKLTVSGGGFTLTIRMRKVSVEFNDAPRAP